MEGVISQQIVMMLPLYVQVTFANVLLGSSMTNCYTDVQVRYLYCIIHTIVLVLCHSQLLRTNMCIFYF